MNDINFPLVIFASFILISIYSISRRFGTLFLNKEKKRLLHEFYSKRLNYYNQLSEKGKDRFLQRAYSLSSNFKVIGRNGFEITEEVKLFVLAAYIQITLGYKYYSLPVFKTILIYPDSYRNPFSGQMHDGEVNPRGVIVLSWKRLLKGYENPSDCINLGLHEMAHALMHVITKTQRFEEGLESEMNYFSWLAKDEIEKIKLGNEHFFRNYAGTNSSEFFAVAVEHFFESPVEMKAKLPKIYKGLVDLLKQDPTIKYFGLN